MHKCLSKKLPGLITEIKRIQQQISVDVPPWTKDELLLQLQELISSVILIDPELAVEQKYEVELWNSVFKQPISWYQGAVRDVSCFLMFLIFLDISIDFFS